MDKINKKIVKEMVAYFDSLSLSKETGRYLSDKSYGYDTIFFMAKFIQKNKTGNKFNKKEQRQRAIEYIEDIFNLRPGTKGAVNYFVESLNLLEFANIIKKIDRDNYIILNSKILNYICEYPENAYIFIYLLTYCTMKNDNILHLFKKLYEPQNTMEINRNIVNEIYNEFYKKSISIGKKDSNWSKQLLQYTNNTLGFINHGIYFARTLNIHPEEEITIYTISLNVEGTRTPIDLKKKNDYLLKFCRDYVLYMLHDYTFSEISYDKNKIYPEETVASELAQLKLEIIDSKVAPNISNDFEKKQFIEDKMKTRNQAVQREFKKGLLENNEHVCPICGFAFSKFLIASHIKPYALCDNTYDAINSYNGLLLCPNHDKLFESAKYMTIDSYTGEIHLNEEARNSKDYGMLEGQKIDIRLVQCERTHYLRWHNQRFKENNENEKSL